MNKPRLYLCNQSMRLHAKLQVNAEKYHYLVNVMRLTIGDCLLVFNGIDGLWEAKITEVKKNSAHLSCVHLVQEQKEEIKLPVSLAFAPLKSARSNIVIQKATELGVSSIIPIVTERSVVREINKEKWEAITHEAAEQSLRLSVPLVSEAMSLASLLKAHGDGVFLCDPKSRNTPIDLFQNNKKRPEYFVFLVGPEGGFTNKEISYLRNRAVYSISLGPRLLRAETASIAILSMFHGLYGQFC